MAILHRFYCNHILGNIYFYVYFLIRTAEKTQVLRTLQDSVVSVLLQAYFTHIHHAIPFRLARNGLGHISLYIWEGISYLNS